MFQINSNLRSVHWIIVFGIITLKIYFYYFYKDGHVQISKVNYLNSSKNEVERSIGSRLLYIQNVTVEDEGYYVCELIMNSERINHSTYALRVNSMYFKIVFFKFCMSRILIVNLFINTAPSKINTHLSLSVRGGSNEIISRAGTPELQVIIDVSANPEPIFTW